jgi:hypothetical protein
VKLKSSGLSLFLALALSAPLSDATQADHQPRPLFQRVATLDVNGAVAEIVAATPDGLTLVYTNATDKKVGFVDITVPSKPVEVAAITINGEPTSVAVTRDGRYALVTVDAAAGAQDQLLVVALLDRTVKAAINLGGQPDSVAVSPSGRYAAIAIENERDESLNSGRMPQLPGGFLTIVDLAGEPAQWTTRNVSLVNLAARFPEDPEPEFVDINAADQAAVTLQENSHVVIVDLVAGTVINHWPAGTTTHAADTVNNNNVSFTNTLTDAPREPDAIAWTPGGRLITANEGDYTVNLAAGQFAGGRDFTVFNVNGGVVFEPGAAYELQAVRHGHYPEGRSRNKGTEPEGVEVGTYQGTTFAFVGSERGHFVAVYSLADETQPKFRQLLPTGNGPEGLLAIPQRNLFVTSNENDGTLSIFALQHPNPQLAYPHVVSDGLWWSALSGLDAGPGGEVYAVPDSALRPSRIFKLNVSTQPAKVESVVNLPGNYDLEGIAVNPTGGFWVVSEGAGNAGAANATKNLLLKVNTDGSLAQTVELPAAVNANQVQFGFEGVATNAGGSLVYVAFQREWADDPARLVKIGQYAVGTGEWKFFHYPIEAPQPGGWVGLSEITRINDTTFAVIERDNQLRENALVKRIYSFSIAGLTPAGAGETPPVVTKSLVRDLLKDDDFRLEKAEGLARTAAGDLLVVNDNDGVGETRLVRLLNDDYNVFLQDDRTGDALRLNTSTGDYVFSRCGPNGFTLTGRGVLYGVGCRVRLRAARLSASIESCGQYSFWRAQVRLLPFGPPITISDRNVEDNVFACR